jgi:nucleoid DNA-binding protein
MTKADLIKEVSEKTRYDSSTVEEVIDCAFKTIKRFVSEEDGLYYRSFGSFIPMQRKAKIGRDIQANKSVSIPARSVPYFRAAKVFKARVAKRDNQ